MKHKVAGIVLIVAASATLPDANAQTPLAERFSQWTGFYIGANGGYA